MAQCNALTKDGKKCKRRAIEGGQFCNLHDPKRKKFRRILSGISLGTALVILGVMADIFGILNFFGIGIWSTPQPTIEPLSSPSATIEIAEKITIDQVIISTSTSGEFYQLEAVIKNSQGVDDLLKQVKLKIDSYGPYGCYPVPPVEYTLVIKSLVIVSKENGQLDLLSKFYDSDEPGFHYTGRGKATFACADVLLDLQMETALNLPANSMSFLKVVIPNTVTIKDDVSSGATDLLVSTFDIVSLEIATENTTSPVSYTKGLTDRGNEILAERKYQADCQQFPNNHELMSKYIPTGSKIGGIEGIYIPLEPYNVDNNGETCKDFYRFYANGSMLNLRTCSMESISQLSNGISEWFAIENNSLGDRDFGTGTPEKGVYYIEGNKLTYTLIHPNWCSKSEELEINENRLTRYWGTNITQYSLLPIER